MSDLNKQLESLYDGKLITEEQVAQLCERCKDLLMEEGNVEVVFAPVTLCGDIHGQFYDLLELFGKGGRPPETSYVFMGDYVDRGYHSIETLLLLLLLKARFPDRMTLLRGNHESRQITQVYGFYDECYRKYGSANVWRLCTELFDYLPLGAVVEQDIFCVHGGLSPSLKTIEEVRLLDRKQEVPHEGPMSDLLWSDPEDIPDGWGISQRGAGFIFGAEAVRPFNYRNGLTLIARAHQLVQEGYKAMFDGSCCTVWSAPNYCYRCGNIASILEIGDNSSERSVIYFGAAPAESRGHLAKHPPPEYFL